MKKISAVLLVLVLVGSVVFAGFTGSATTSFGYDLDSTKYGFNNGQAVSVDVNFLEMVGEAKSSGDVYVDIKATLNFSFSNADAKGLLSTDDTSFDNRTDIIVKADFKHAKIVGDNWYVGILGALDAPNFATSAIDSADTADGTNKLGFKVEKADTFADLKFVKEQAAISGVEVGFADYVFSLGAEGNADAETYKFYGTALTPAYEFADGLTAKFGAAGYLSDTKKIFGASTKVDYANDDLAVGVAADALLVDKDFDVDVAVAASYYAYSLDVYFATRTNDTVVLPVVDNLLSVEFAAVIDPVTVTVTGKDLINEQDLGVSVKFQATDELAVTARGGYVINTEDWNAGADLVYAAEDFVAKLSGTFNKGEVIEMAASVASETLVPGATLKLAWEDAKDLLKKGGSGSKELGKVTASVKIAF